MGRLKSLAPRVPTLNTQRAQTLTTSSSRTRGRAWMSIRDRIMRRDRGLCQMHTQIGLVQLAAEVDHKVELDDGGTDDDGNLWCLCQDCHLWKSGATRRARLAGSPMRSVEDVDAAVAEQVRRMRAQQRA